MSRIKWGILGCSDFARRRAIPAMLQTPSVELVAIASRDRDKAEGFRARFDLPKVYQGYERLMEDPSVQAVYIPLPNCLHAEWAIQAAEAGKHSLCEKPFACTLAEATSAASTAARAGVCTAEAFMWRFHLQHERARELVLTGEIGPVRLVHGTFSFLMSRDPNIRFTPDLGGGCFMDLGCYGISAARYYFAEEPLSVYARAEYDAKFGVDMRTCAMLEFAQGRAIVDCAYDLPHRTRLEIVGERGVVTIPQPWQPDPEAVIMVNGRPERLPVQNHYVSMFDDFSRSLLNGRLPRYGAEDAVRQMRVMDAVRRSLRDERCQVLKI